MTIRMPGTSPRWVQWMLLTCLWFVAHGQARAQSTPDSWEAILGATLDEAALRRVDMGIDVVRMSDGARIFARQADDALVPASTMKVLTAAAALRVLGPSFSFRTGVYMSGERQGTRLAGDLFLQGRGDPTLVYERLWKLLRDVRQDGVHHIAGDMVIDTSYFSDGPRIPGWDKKEDLEKGPSYFPSIGSVALDFGAVTMVVRPGEAVGQPANVMLAVPAGAYISLDANVVTGRPRSRSRVEIERTVSAGAMRFALSGTVPLDGGTRRYRRAVADPDAYAVAVVRALLDQLDIGIDGTVRLGTLAEESVSMRQLYSPPLASILMDTNKYSSNFMAEMVLRAMGAEAGEGGDTASGLDQVRTFLSEIGIARSEVQMTNGSGLSRDTRFSASVLTRVLLEMARDPVVGHEFVGSLSIAGRDGTLRRRMSDVAGRIRGKTGTLGGVHTLAGYVVGADGEVYAFGFLVNNVRGSLAPVKKAQDVFLTQLATASVP